MDGNHKKHFRTIAEILAMVEDVDDMENLLLDLFTKKEAESLYQRFRVAQMLRNGLKFVEIEEITGISSTTITRVNKCLKNGKGYNVLFEDYNLSIDLS